MSWDEFNELTNILIKKITDYFSDTKQVHVVSQLHRTGGIVGSVLAIKMEIVPLLPVQFKYSYNPTPHFPYQVVLQSKVLNAPSM